MLQIFKPEAYQSYRIRARLYIVKTSPKPFLRRRQTGAGLGKDFLRVHSTSLFPFNSRSVVTVTNGTFCNFFLACLISLRLLFHFLMQLTSDFSKNQK